MNDIDSDCSDVLKKLNKIAKKILNEVNNSWYQQLILSQSYIEAYDFLLKVLDELASEEEIPGEKYAEVYELLPYSNELTALEKPNAVTYS